MSVFYMETKVLPLEALNSKVSNIYNAFLGM